MNSALEERNEIQLAIVQDLSDRACFSVHRCVSDTFGNLYSNSTLGCGRHEYRTVRWTDSLHTWCLCLPLVREGFRNTREGHPGAL